METAAARFKAEQGGKRQAVSCSDEQSADGVEGRNLDAVCFLPAFALPDDRDLSLSNGSTRTHSPWRG